eukprot:Sspe_Gene.22737::Locus_8697_Transcript_1_1_Confidence_1.000_Length_6825::g.22737::m.22737
MEGSWVLLVLLLQHLVLPGGADSAVKVAVGWVCAAKYQIDSGVAATATACEGVCSGTANCTAFLHRGDGTCRTFSACLISERSIDGTSGLTATYLMRVPPVYSSAPTRTFTGSPGEALVTPYDPKYSRSSWTVDFWARPKGTIRNGRAAVSTCGMNAGYAVLLGGQGRWELHVGNGTYTNVIFGTPARMYVWSRVTARYSGVDASAVLEVDGIEVGIGHVGFFPTTATALRVGADQLGLEWVGDLRGVAVYDTLLDSTGLRAIEAPYPPETCRGMHHPTGISLTTHQDYVDHGASLNGRCYFIGEATETCAETCSKIGRAECVEDGTAEAALTSASCESAMQRLGMAYNRVKAAEGSDGCLWDSEEHTVVVSPGVGCDSRPVAEGGNTTKRRVCECRNTGPGATATETAALCGGDVCTPCPELLFQRPTWSVISSVAACSANHNGTGALLAEVNTVGGLAECQSRCEGEAGCVAIDYFSDSGGCNLYSTACTHPTAEGNGSSSHRLSPADPTTCSASGLIASLFTTHICECQARCQTVQGALYGSFRRNESGGACSCYRTCDSTTSTIIDGDSCVGCSNMTAFLVPRAQQRSTPCRPTGMASLLEGGAGIDLGALELGKAGVSFSAWLRHRPDEERRGGRGSVWRVTNLNTTERYWDLCEVAFYSTPDCSGENITYAVLASSTPQMENSPPVRAIDGIPDTCAGVSCGEGASGEGCAPKMGSFRLLLALPVEPKCVKLQQSKDPRMTSSSVAIELLSDTGVWVPQWECHLLTPGAYHACGKGEGLALITVTETWRGARDHCSKLGGDLVSIRSEAVDRAVGGLVSLVRKNAWVGAYREDSKDQTESGLRAENVFRWVDEAETKWFTQTPTLTSTETRSEVNDRTPRSYSHWACDNQHPMKGRGDCVYVHGSAPEAAHICPRRGFWSPTDCTRTLPAFICDLSAARAPFSNGTATQTATETEPTVSLSPERVPLFSVANGLDDQVLLTMDPNGTQLTYEVVFSVPSSWPSAGVKDHSRRDFAGGVPGDGRWHHLALLHKPSGATTVFVDSSPVGLAPFGTPPDSTFTSGHLELWLRAHRIEANSSSEVVDGSVQLWRDTSPKGRDAVMVQGAPEYVPLAQKEWPAVRFAPNGTATGLSLGASYVWATGTGLTIIIVARPTGGGEAGYVLDFGSSTDGKHWGVSLLAERVTCAALPELQGAAVTSWRPSWDPPGDNGWVLVSCRIAFGGDLTLRVNGFDVARAANTLSALGTSQISYASSRGQTAGPIAIGLPSATNDASGKHFSGDVAELLVYSTALTDSKLAEVEEALATKYFGGVFSKMPASVPRERGTIGSSSTMATTFRGTVRDVAVWDKAVDDDVIFSVAAHVDVEDEFTPLRQAACTSPCVGDVSATSPRTRVGWTTGTPVGGAVFAGTLLLHSLPSADQPILTYGGSGCNGGTLTAWAFPRPTGGYSLAFGEWGGRALHTSESYALGQRYPVRFEYDDAVVPSTVPPGMWEGAAILSFETISGAWAVSPDKCQGAGECVMGTPGPDAPRTAVLRSPEVVLNARAWIAVVTVGAAGTPAVLRGKRTADRTGFAGVGLWDPVARVYVASVPRRSTGWNSTGEETLTLTQWDLRGLSGRRVAVDLVDAGGRMGVRKVVVVGANSTYGVGRIVVGGHEVVRGEVRRTHPLESGEVALMTRCGTSGASYAGEVAFSAIGCPGGNETDMLRTVTVSVTPTATPDYVCSMMFGGVPSDYLSGGKGNMGTLTFGGPVTIAVWVRLHSKPREWSKILDMGNAPGEHRMSLGFYGATGSVVYQVEEYGPYEVRKSGIADPAIGAVPSPFGADNVRNVYVSGEYLTYVGCYSENNVSAFAGGRVYGDIGGSLGENVPRMVGGGYRYMALSNPPSHHAVGGAGGAYFFNLLTAPPDLTVEDCRVVPCDSGDGLCGCTGGGQCGLRAMDTGRCLKQHPANACPTGVQNWAVWERVYPTGPQLPTDKTWHHIAVVHRYDTTILEHGLFRSGTATLYIDFAPTHTARAILPTMATRVDCYVGRSLSGDPDFYGELREILVWNGALSLSELRLVNEEHSMSSTSVGVPLIKAMAQDCGVPPQGYGQCIDSPELPRHPRVADPKLCHRPLCECIYNGFRCAVSRYGRDYDKVRYSGEGFGRTLWVGGEYPGVHTPRMGGRCFVNTFAPEGCHCEGTLVFVSFDPEMVTHPLLCDDVLHAFDGRLAPHLPDEIVVPSPAGRVRCYTNTTRSS